MEAATCTDTVSPSEPGERPHFASCSGHSCGRTLGTMFIPSVSGAHGFQGGFPLGNPNVPYLELFGFWCTYSLVRKDIQKEARRCPGEGERFCPQDRASYSELALKLSVVSDLMGFLLHPRKHLRSLQGFWPHSPSRPFGSCVILPAWQ